MARCMSEELLPKGSEGYINIVLRLHILLVSNSSRPRSIIVPKFLGYLARAAFVTVFTSMRKLEPLLYFST